MEYFAVFVPSLEEKDSLDPEEFIFESKDEALKAVKANKESRFKSFKNRNEALKFVKNGILLNQQASSSGTNKQDLSPSSSFDLLKSPPPNSIPTTRLMEKSLFPSLKPQDYVAFRKLIEQNNIAKVYELICTNPRYLVSSGDTPSILKEGTRYNALHIASIFKHARMAKLILQTVEQTSFIEHMHGFSNDPNIEVMSLNLLESYLNTPDKSRNETPLHFAAKFGVIDVIEVLLSYPMCKMKTNSEGKYPKDIICERAQDTPIEVKKAIEDLLKERFFVPVLRSNDNSVQPIIGNPFTPSNMPTIQSPNNPRETSMEIKAYAGPMTSEQAQTFQKRWKTPPRLIPTSTSAHNLSFSPKSNAISSPLHSPRQTKSFHVLQSTPKLKKRLQFDGNGGEGDFVDEFESVYLSNLKENDKNGNHKVAILNEQEEEEFKELFDDLMRDKIELMEEKQGKFRAYRNPEPTIPETPIRNITKNDSNSNHLSHNYNNTLGRLNSNDSLFCNPPSGSIGSGFITSFLDESGSVFSPNNLHDSISFKEKNIRLMDTSKGLEKIGRGLASEYNVGWKEYWDFLGHFLDIRSDEGMEKFEEFLKKKDKQKEVNESEVASPLKLNDSFGLNSICAGLYSMDINDELSKPTINKNGLVSPSSARSPLMEMLTNKRPAPKDLPIDNPFTCIEQSCRTFAKRLASLLESETIQDQNSYEKVLLAEVNKLNTSIDSYKRDARFSAINFQKVHSRYSYLLVWYLKSNNINVKYHRNAVPLMSKVYNLARQFTSLHDMKDLIKTHSICISNFTSTYIEREERIFNPENVDSETGCFAAWNGPDILDCKCSLELNFASTKQRQSHRRDIRKRLYGGGSLLKSVDLWAPRTTSIDSDDEKNDSYLSCDDDDSENDEWFTPPQSPRQIESSDDEMNAFEESLEYLEENEKVYSLFINGDEPMKIDSDVFTAIGEDFVVDEVKYPLVFQWHKSMKFLNSKSGKDDNKIFRLFTPKLKLKS